MGTYNAYLHTSATALRSLSTDGMMPIIFNALPQYKAPVVSLIFFSLTTAVLVFFDFSVLVEVESFLYSVHVLILCSSLVRLKYKRPLLNIPSTIPGGAVGVAVVAFLPSVVVVALFVSVLLSSHWAIPLVGLLMMVSAVAMFFLRVYVLPSWMFAEMDLGLQ